MESAPIWTDLKTFPWESFRDRVDILTGGYPCQPFSAAGKRAGKEDPRHLWPWIADGIRILRPRVCFFENVEGHISLGLSSVISDLEELGYKVSWGIFSAREVGAPHQRKRVFILAHSADQRPEWSSTIRSPSASEAVERCGVWSWPSRPGQPQYAWEPPRVVANSESQRARGRSELCGEECGSRGILPRLSGQSGEVVGNATSKRPYRGSEDGANQQPEMLGEGHEAMGNAAEQGCQRSGGANDPRGTIDRPTESNRGCAYGAMEQGERQAQPPLGRNPDGTSDWLDYTELYTTCDNRTDELRLLGNGVVPATAERAFRTLTELLTNKTSI